MTTPKSCERYGIHALEGVHGLLSPGGWLSFAEMEELMKIVIAGIRSRRESGRTVALKEITTS